MKCPYCEHTEDRVVDTRANPDETAIRRRRECTKCGRRFTTYEYVEKMPIMVVKKDGRREPFDRQKLLNGLVLACSKRPVSREKIERLVDDVENALAAEMKGEVPTSRLGDMVMSRLSELDQVAYVRFASVYRSFRDTHQFMEELKRLLEEQQPS
jgi:transcriptional repressor NrdR